MPSIVSALYRRLSATRRQVPRAVPGSVRCMHLPDFLQTDRPFVPLNLGGNPFGWTTDEEASFAVLDRFVDGGGSFVDTADAYSSWVPGHTGGESERIIGAWLAQRGLRERVQIATKVAKKPDRAGLARETVRLAVEESRERLGVEVIDLCYAHADDETVPVEDQVETFHALVEAGHIRAVGLSNYTAARLREWVTAADRLGLTPPAAIQPRYTLVSRAAYEQDLAPVVAELSLAVFSFPALASGFLTGKYRTPEDFEGAARGSAARRYAEAGGLRVVDAVVQVGQRRDAEPAAVVIAWLLARGITAPIASASRPEQLEPLLAGTTLTLTAEDLTDLDEASEGF